MGEHEKQRVSQTVGHRDRRLERDLGFLELVAVEKDTRPAEMRVEDPAMVRHPERIRAGQRSRGELRRFVQVAEPQSRVRAQRREDDVRNPLVGYRIERAHDLQRARGVTHEEPRLREGHRDVRRLGGTGVVEPGHRTPAPEDGPVRVTEEAQVGRPQPVDPEPERLVTGVLPAALGAVQPSRGFVVAAEPRDDSGVGQHPIRVLLEIANTPDKLNGDDIARIEQAMNTDSLLFQIRVLRARNLWQQPKVDSRLKGASI